MARAAPPFLTLAGRPRLVVFDLDGTLYRQGPVRQRMALALMADLLRSRDARRLRALRDFRARREAMAGARDFEDRLYSETARACAMPETALRALVADWIETRPLAHLRAARIAGAGALFARLRGAGVRVAVWSDYPVPRKLEALGLAADTTLDAAGAGALKPDPAGLRLLLRQAGCGPDAALMVGDRLDRDGAAARALGVAFLLRATRGPEGVPRVADFTDPRLAPLWSP